MEDWGEIVSIQMTDSEDFWSIYDEMENDNSGFLANRSIILDAWKAGNMYGLQVEETEAMYERQACYDRLFCARSYYLLPCFCIKNDNKAEIIWTHSRARGKGFARKLVQMLNITEAYQPLPESIGFWEKCGII